MRVDIETRATVRAGEPPPRPSDIVELSLLLSAEQLNQLESAARGQGLTIGQMMRRLINAFLHEPA
jgi:hypothetical protein